MLSVFLQLPLQGFLLINPYFELGVLQVVSQSVLVVMLVGEIALGYGALRYTAAHQALEHAQNRLHRKIVAPP